jgi:exosortase family protein XrtF
MGWYSYQNRLNHFLIKSGLLLTIYQLLSITYHRTAFVRIPFKAIAQMLVTIVVYASQWILKIMGEDAMVYNNVVRIGQSGGVRVIFGCLAISLMALFAGFILCYPGKRSSKYWFIPMGVVLIFFMNIIRITGMALFSNYAPHVLNFYHRYVFKYALHGFILLLWIIWVNRYGERTSKPAS